MLVHYDVQACFLYDTVLYDASSCQCVVYLDRLYMILRIDLVYGT